MRAGLSTIITLGQRCVCSGSRAPGSITTSSTRTRSFSNSSRCESGAAINASSSGGHGHSLAEGRTSIQLALKRSSVSAQLGRRSDAVNSHCTNLLGPTHGSSELISRTPRAVRMNAGDGILVGGTREAITRHAWRHWIVASVRRHAPAVTSTPTRVADMLCRGLVRLAGAARRSSRSASHREQRRGAVAVERPHPRC
jgi:hypothetical protein